MLHTISTPLKPNEILEDDSEASLRIRYATASDAILARLSLTERVPPRMMDLVISAIRDPLFDPKELTSKRSADIYLQAMKSRMQDTTSLDRRSGYPPNIFPQDVLVNIIDILKAEALSALAKLSVSEYQLRGVLWDSLCTEELTALHLARTTLAVCSLVHTSWFIVARRALGTILLSLKGSALHDALRSPCFGDWTTEVCLTLKEDHHPQHLVPLFSRLPNVKFVKLDLQQLHSTTAGLKNLALALCDAISYLLHLEEYVICNIDWRHLSEEDLSRFTQTTAPSLEIVRFVSLPVRHYASPHLDHFSHLRSIPSLKHVHIHNTVMERGARIQISVAPMCHVFWARRSATEDFVLDTVGMYTVRQGQGISQLGNLVIQLSAVEEAVFATCRQLTIDTKFGGDAGRLASVFNASVSVTALHIRLEAFEHLSSFDLLVATLPALVELHITFPYSGGPRDFADADELMSQLMSNGGQKVKMLKAHFFAKRGYDYHESFMNLLFPNCYDMCSGRGIFLDITVNDFTELSK